VNQYKQQEAIDTIPWLAMLPEMNPIEHVWDYIGQRLNHRNPQCQNLAEGIAIHLSVHNAIENIKVQLASERKATPHSYNIERGL
jgi:hypothetical protein